MAESTTPICTTRNAVIAVSFIAGACLLSEVVAAIRNGIPIDKLYSLNGLDKYRVVWTEQFVGIPLVLWSTFAGGRVIYDLYKGPTRQKPPPPPPPQRIDPPRRLQDNQIPKRVKLLPEELEEKTGFDQPMNRVGTILSTNDEGASLTIGGTTIELKVCNIEQVKTETVVNAANESGPTLSGAGITGAFGNRDSAQKPANYTRGPMGQELFEIREHLGRNLVAGEAALTCGWKDGPTYGVHAVGPRCTHTSKEAHNEHKTCPTRLRQAYLSSLALAEDKGAQSIAFPFLSAAIFGYKAEYGSSDVALRTMQDYFTLLHPDSKIKHVVFVSLQKGDPAFVGFLKAVKAHCIFRRDPDDDDHGSVYQTAMRRG